MSIYDGITKAWLIANYLQDLDLRGPDGLLTAEPTGQNGLPFPALMYQTAIESAVEAAAAKFDVVTDGVLSVVGERHDEIRNSTPMYVSKFLRKKPVWSITKVQVQFGNFAPAPIPNEWVEIVNEDLGEVRIMPAGQPWAIALPGLIALWAMNPMFQPGLWRFDYEAGFDSIKGQDPPGGHPMPTMLADWIGSTASFSPSGIAGDLLGGSGIASYSRSQDGVSTSVNTTSSPENHGFSAKQKQQMKYMQGILEPALYGRFRAPLIGAI